MVMKIGAYLEFMGEGDSTDPIDEWLGKGNHSFKIEGSLGHLAYAAKKLKGIDNAFLVGRDIPRMEEIMQGIPPSTSAAEYWWDRVADLIRPLPKRIFWEDAYNELGPFEDPAVRKGFCDFEVRRGELMHAEGYHCCFLNISAETAPLLAQHIDDFLPVFQMAYEHNDLIGLHSYFSPRFFTIENGVEVMEPVAERFLFPHRQLVRELNLRGLSIPWFFYTEGPAIDTILQLNRHYDGFRVAGLNEEEYANQIRWAENVLHPDRNFVGGAVYIWEKGEQADKTQYNIATGREAHPKRNDPGSPPTYQFMLDMSTEFGPGTYRAPVTTIPPPPPPEPPPLPPPVVIGAGPAVVIGNDEGGTHYHLNLRLTPRNAGADNLLYQELPDGTPVTMTGKTQNGYAEVKVAFELNDSGQIFDRTGWLLERGLKRV